jgi:hypothetical protein
VLFDFLVNDRGDFCIKIRNANDLVDESGKTRFNTIYFYENFDKILNNKRQDVEAVQGLYATKDHGDSGYIFNRKYLFFWNKK